MSPTIYLSMILCFALSFVVVRLLRGTWKVDDGDFEDIIFPSVPIGFFIGLIIWFSAGNSYQPESSEYITAKRNLVALKDGQNINGSFFLGSGNFDSDMSYYGYESLGDSRYKMVEFPKSSIIIEDIKEGETPYFVQIRKKADISDVIKYDKWIMGPLEHDKFIRWEIHLPKNSILKSEYILDAQ